MPIRNAYTAHSANSGDCFVAVVTCHIMPDGTYRLYRCAWPPQMAGDTPQGLRMFSVPGGQLSHMVQQLFPIVPNCHVKEDV